MNLTGMPSLLCCLNYYFSFGIQTTHLEQKNFTGDNQTFHAECYSIPSDLPSLLEIDKSGNLDRSLMCIVFS